MPNCTHSLLLWNFTPHNSDEIRQVFEDEILEFIRGTVTCSHVDSESKPSMLKLKLKLIYQTSPKYAFNVTYHISNINKWTSNFQVPINVIKNDALCNG